MDKIGLAFAPGMLDANVTMREFLVRVGLCEAFVSQPEDIEAGVFVVVGQSKIGLLFSRSVNSGLLQNSQIGNDRGADL